MWLGFKGGKGVATYIGVLLGLAWPAALVFGVVWIAVAALSRYSSLAALMGSVAAPAFLWLIGENRLAGLFLVLTLVLWVMHRANIARLVFRHGRPHRPALIRGHLSGNSFRPARLYFRL